MKPDIYQQNRYLLPNTPCLHIHPGKAVQTLPPLSACIQFLCLTMKFFMEQVKRHICVAYLCGPASPYVRLPSILPHTQSESPSLLAYSEPALPVPEKPVTAQFPALACQVTIPDLEGEGGRLVSEIHQSLRASSKRTQQAVVTHLGELP